MKDDELLDLSALKLKAQREEGNRCAVCGGPTRCNSPIPHQCQCTACYLGVPKAILDALSERGVRANYRNN